jgi:hypothetical protein
MERGSATDVLRNTMHFCYNGPNLKRRNEFLSLTPEINIFDIMQILLFLQDFEIDIPTRSHKNTFEIMPGPGPGARLRPRGQR